MTEVRILGAGGWMIVVIAGGIVAVWRIMRSAKKRAQKAHDDEWNR